MKKQNRVMILDLTIYNLRMFNWENNPPLNKINVTGTEDMPNSMPPPPRLCHKSSQSPEAYVPDEFFDKNASSGLNRLT